MPGWESGSQGQEGPSSTHAPLVPRNRAERASPGCWARGWGSSRPPAHPPAAPASNATTPLFPSPLGSPPTWSRHHLSHLVLGPPPHPLPRACTQGPSCLSGSVLLASASSQASLGEGDGSLATGAEPGGGSRAGRAEDSQRLRLRPPGGRGAQRDCVSAHVPVRAPRGSQPLC